MQRILPKLPITGRTIHEFGELFLRFLAIIGLCFWMGGFTFYAGVVIHIGHRVFHSHREIGFLTREVTVWLNRSGVIVLLLLILNHFYYARREAAWLTYSRLGTLVLMAAIQVALFLIHPKLDQILDVPTHGILNRSAFRSMHLLYVNLSTVQWSAALAHLITILLGWRRSDLAGNETICSEVT